jgi:hypothetical protein
MIYSRLQRMWLQRATPCFNTCPTTIKACNQGIIDPAINDSPNKKRIAYGKPQCPSRRRHDNRMPQEPKEPCHAEEPCGCGSFMQQCDHSLRTLAVQATAGRSVKIPVPHATTSACNTGADMLPLQRPRKLCAAAERS